MSRECENLVERSARVRIYSGAAPGSVMAEGTVIGYLARPTLLIRHDDGTQSSWSVDLPREEIAAAQGSEPYRGQTAAEFTADLKRRMDAWADAISFSAGDFERTDEQA